MATPPKDNVPAPKDAAAKVDAAAQNLDVTLSASEAPPATLHVKPHDVIRIHGLTLKDVKIDLIGPDLIIADLATGNKLIMPGIGLFMFSVTEAPHFIFENQEISQDDLLAKIGYVVNITDKDYITYTSLALNQHEKAPPPTPEAPHEVKPDTTLLKLQMLAEARPETFDSSPSTTAGDPPDDLKARESLISNSVGQPPLPQVTPSTPVQSSQTVTIKTLDARATFDFDSRLLQVQSQDDTSGPVRTYYGGGGSAASFFSPSNGVQYSTEIIDTVSDPNPVTIYTDNPTYFSSTTMSRGMQMSPNLPDGFKVTSVTISGLPAGFSIEGAAGGGGTYTVTNPVLDALGNINFVVIYNNLAPQTFSLHISAVADFDPASGFGTPPTTTLTHAVDVGVAVRTVTTAADYSYTDPSGHPGWVLATNPNDNKILAGDGGITVYGGIGKDDVLTGNGNDTVYGSASDDKISTGGGNDFLNGGRGNDTMDGGLGADTADYSDAAIPVTVDLSLVAGGYSTAFVGVAETDLLKNIENITGGDGNDTITGDNGDNVLNGGAGDDLISGHFGNDTIIGGGGTDTVDYTYASLGITINLATGTVAVQGGDTDTLTGIQNAIGTAFDDVLVASAVSNRLDGAGGNNTVSYAPSATAVTVDLAAGTATGSGSDVLLNIQNIIGSANGDSLSGDGAVNIINGLAGNDTINGRGGNDVVYGGLGSDNMDGGLGTDQLRFDDLGGSGVALDLATGKASYAFDGSTDTFSNFEEYYLSNQGDMLNGSAGADVVFGLGGNDTLNGNNGNDTLDAGLGDDTLSGGAGNDTLLGNAGDDVVYGGAGNDTMDGDIGNDQLRFDDLTGSVALDLSTSTAFYATDGSTDTFTNFETYYLSNQGDTLTGSVGDDTVFGLGGDDTMNGNDGDDALDGGAGNDTVSGDLGDDTLFGNTGNDTVYGGLGNDTMDGGLGNDQLRFDDLSGSVALDLSTSTAFYATDGSTDNFINFESYYLSNQDDTLAGSVGNDTVFGLDGNDTLDGAGGSDTLDGGNDDDTVTGGAGNDTLFGGVGDDTVYGGLGSDAMDGGLGNDQARFDDLAAGGVALNLAAGTAFYATDSSTDTVTGFESYYLSNQADTLTGSASADVVYGQDGDDALSGGGGNDMLDGGAGNDTLDGGLGNDTLQAGDDDDTVYGGGGNDTMDGGLGTDQLRFDDLTGSVSLDLSTSTAFYATDGSTDNFANFESYYLSNQADTLTGSAGDDTVFGLGGDDTLTANNGNDTIDGGAGNDTIDGGAGNDTLQGNTGNDVVYGGLGSDTMDGGIGTDQLRFDDLVAGGVTLDLAATTAVYSFDGSTDTFSNFESYYLSNQADTLSGSVGDDTVFGQGGDDILNGNNGNDTLDGGTGNDTLNGGSGTDTLSGNTGNDIVYGGLGSDTMDGGIGTDQLRFDDLAGGGVALNLATSTAFFATDGSTDSFVNFESYYLSNQNDTLTDSAGDDTVFGLNGNDTFTGGLGNDTLDGGLGTDTIDYSGAAGVMTVNLLAGTATGMGNDTLANVENITGSNFDDTLTGNNSANTILGGGGNDTMVGNNGNDTMDGGAGVNTVSYTYTVQDLYSVDMNTLDVNGYWKAFVGYGGEFDLVKNVTTIYGGGGNDSYYLNNSGITVYTGAGDDFVSGGNGDDYVDTGTGSDYILAGNGNDTIIATGSFGFSDLEGGAGNDTIVGGAFGDYFVPGAGNDSVTGGAGYDYLDYYDLSGGVTLHLDTSSSTDFAGGVDTFTSIEEFYLTGFNDTVYSSNGNNTVYDFGGTNTFYASLGTDYFYGGGNDTIDYSLMGVAVTANLGASTATAAGMSETLVTFENIVGSGFDDTLTGSNGANTIQGGNGNDTMVGGLGNDTMDGGAGSNTVSYGYTGTSLTTNMASVNGGGYFTVTLGGENDLVKNIAVFIAGSGNDTITGDGGNNNIQGGNGNDTIDGGTGNDTLDGQGGTDTLTYATRAGITGITLDMNVVAGGYSTVTVGGVGESDLIAGFENITGSGFDDTVTGDANDNSILGLAGNDTLNGGAGNDTIDGGLGNDALDGGAGTGDIITYASESAFVTVNLFTGTASGTSSGNDTLANFENITGSNFDDVLTGDDNAANPNTILGGLGNDYIDGRAGNDSLDGGAGTDTIVGSAGNDSINGGAGFDIADYSVGGAINVNLQTGIVSDGFGGTDTLVLNSIEEVDGSDSDDTFRDGTINETLRGHAGNDTFNDFDNSGSDSIFGDAGNDTVDYSGTAGSVTGNIQAAGGQTFGTIQKTVDGSSDSLFSIEKIVTGNSGDTFTLDTNSLLVFTNFNTNGGNDKIIVKDTSGANLTADGIDGTTMASVFQNIETLDMRGATLTGPDSFDLQGSDVNSVVSGSHNLLLQVKQNFSLNVINNLAVVSSSGTVNDTTTVGTINSVTWDSGSGYNVTLQVETVA